MSACALCFSDKKNDTLYGEFLTKGSISVHTYCLYVSSNLTQNGQEKNGFYGFLQRDILAESRRASKLTCYICKKPGANIGCCQQKCRQTFHFICGLENDCENQFIGTYKSFCKKHTRKYPARKISDNETCVICLELLKKPGKTYNSTYMIRAPCCRNGWFHKYCLQGFAKSSGYFFKCPLCNNKDVFHRGSQIRGIFIPQRDAAWELEPNAFSELYQRPKICKAITCKNKSGPRKDCVSNPFIYCNYCGGEAIHEKCLTIEQGSKNSYSCPECVQILNNDSGRESMNSTNNALPNTVHISQNDSNEVCDDDDEVDVCMIDSEPNELLINKPKIQSDLSIVASNMSKNKCVIYDDFDESESKEDKENDMDNDQGEFILVVDSDEEDTNRIFNAILTQRGRSSSGGFKSLAISKDCKSFENENLVDCSNILKKTDESFGKNMNEMQYENEKQHRFESACKNNKASELRNEENLNQVPVPKHLNYNLQKTYKDDINYRKSDDENSLNMSCVALRTRRKSIHSVGNIFSSQSSQSSQLSQSTQSSQSTESSQMFSCSSSSKELGTLYKKSPTKKQNSPRKKHKSPVKRQKSPEKSMPIIVIDSSSDEEDNQEIANFNLISNDDLPHSSRSMLSSHQYAENRVRYPCESSSDSFPDSYYKKQESLISTRIKQRCKTPFRRERTKRLDKKSESMSLEKNNNLEISCIALRTRRKSCSERILTESNSQELSLDNNRSDYFEYQPKKPVVRVLRLSSTSSLSSLNSENNNGALQEDCDSVDFSEEDNQMATSSQTNKACKRKSSLINPTPVSLIAVRGNGSTVQKHNSSNRTSLKSMWWSKTSYKPNIFQNGVRKKSPLPKKRQRYYSCDSEVSRAASPIDTETILPNEPSQEKHFFYSQQTTTHHYNHNESEIFKNSFPNSKQQNQVHHLQSRQ